MHWFWLCSCHITFFIYFNVNCIYNSMSIFSCCASTYHIVSYIILFTSVFIYFQLFLSLNVTGTSFVFAMKRWASEIKQLRTVKTCFPIMYLYSHNVFSYYVTVARQWFCINVLSPRTLIIGFTEWIDLHVRMVTKINQSFLLFNSTQAYCIWLVMSLKYACPTASAATIWRW